MINQQQQQQIIKLIATEKERLGSYSAVATKCNVSDGAISLMAANKYNTKGDDMWLKVGAALGWKPDADKKGWKLADTRDYRMMMQIMSDAKSNNLFMAVSDYAGSGKSTAINSMLDMYSNGNVFAVKCRNWGKKDFMFNLCRSLGLSVGTGHKTPDDLLNIVVDFFNTRATGDPLLIIDQANSLKPAALTMLIPLYNECEDKLGVVISGNESLEKTIKRGVKYATDGFDEIDSRFGRRFIKLTGATMADVTKICEANGFTDKTRIKEIFEECGPIRDIVTTRDGQKQSIRFIKDLRRLKRIILREKMI